MINPIGCLEEGLREIEVELDFTKDTMMKSYYKKLKESYEIAIEILEENEDSDENGKIPTVCRR